MPLNEQARPVKAVHKLAAELIEAILINLEPVDVVRAKQVCTAWRDVVDDSPILLRLTHKMPTPLLGDENPHLEEPSELSRNVLIPLDEFAGQPLWPLVRQLEDEYLATFSSLSDEQWKAKQELDRVTRARTFLKRMFEIRTALRGLRVDNIWPPGFREISCAICARWHTQFRFADLHPLLQFLGHGATCFRGHKTLFVFNIRFFSDLCAPKSLFERGRADAITFACHLKKALKALEAGGMRSDVASRPIITKLVAYDRFMVENDNGLTLRDVAYFIIRPFHFIIQHQRQSLRNWHGQKDKFKVNKRMYEKVSYMYPAFEDWTKHMEAFEDIVTIWEATSSDVDAIMSEFEDWRSLRSLGE